MPAYVIADVEVHDPEAYRAYQRQASDIAAHYGGRVVVRGGRTEPLEGNWQPARVVIIEFPSFDKATAWYGSPEYQAILPIRHQHATTNFVCVIDGDLSGAQQEPQ
jgi:uncharacterized protein (DUF1330 family)